MVLLNILRVSTLSLQREPPPVVPEVGQDAEDREGERRRRDDEQQRVNHRLLPPATRFSRPRRRSNLQSVTNVTEKGLCFY